MPRTTSRRNMAVIIVAIVVALVVIFVGFGPSGLFFARSVCKLGGEVGTWTIWSPEALVNKPDSTNVSIDVASVNYTFTSGSVSMGSLPATPRGNIDNFGEFDARGGILGGYVNTNFTFYRVENDSVLGATSSPCTQPYVATAGPELNCAGATYTIPMADNVSDLNEPHVWNGTTGINGSGGGGCPTNTPGTYVWFDTSFHPAATGNSAPLALNLCRSQSAYPLVLDGIARVPVIVTVPYEGRTITASGLLTWQGQPNPPPPVSGTLSPATAYWFLSAGWNWSLAPVGPVGFAINPAQPLPGPVAFVRSAC
jgi:hypothetical protein